MIMQDRHVEHAHRLASIRLRLSLLRLPRQAAMLRARADTSGQLQNYWAELRRDKRIYFFVDGRAKSRKAAGKGGSSQKFFGLHGGAGAADAGEADAELTTSTSAPAEGSVDDNGNGPHESPRFMGRVGGPHPFRRAACPAAAARCGPAVCATACIHRAMYRAVVAGVIPLFSLELSRIESLSVVEVPGHEAGRPLLPAVQLLQITYADSGAGTVQAISQLFADPRSRRGTTGRALLPGGVPSAIEQGRAAHADGRPAGRPGGPHVWQLAFPSRQQLLAWREDIERLMKGRIPISLKPEWQVTLVKPPRDRR